MVVEDMRRILGQSPITAKIALISKFLMACAALCCFSFPAEAKDRDSYWNSPSLDLTVDNSAPVHLSQSTTSVQSKTIQFPDASHIPLPQLAPLTLKGKWKLYLKSTYGPLSFGYRLASAGIDQAQDSVPDWGQGMKGYLKRFGSNFGQGVVDNSTRIGFQAIFHEDPRYLPSGRSGFLCRMAYAVKQEIISRKDSGGVRIGYTRFLATTTGVVVSRQWQPGAERTAGKYMSAIATSIAWDAALNIVSEFWPRKKR
jgi:hypothetical protein